MKRVLIIEDDTELHQELKILLERNGYEAEYLTDFSNACEDMLEFGADMILLDITLPNVDGGSLLREFRKQSDIPVIMVTSRNTEMEIHADFPEGKLLLSSLYEIDKSMKEHLNRFEKAEVTN